jgi:hypothetical protein
MNAGRHEAIADFPDLPADGNLELPAKEVHRDSPAHAAAPEETRREPAPEPEAVTPPPTRRRSGTSSEPKLERIVAGEQVTEEAAASPARKGWWNRK